MMAGVHSPKLWLSLALAAAVCGCQSGPPPGSQRAGAMAIQFSPNGEPLSGGPLGHPKCADALSGWFDRMDANHRGFLDRDEFLNDARQQFARMDIHQAGYVTAADLSEYRAPYEPPVGGPGRPDMGGQGGGGQGGEVGRPGRSGDMSGPPSRSGGGRSDQGSRGPTVDTRADPVMSADKLLKFKVTLEDFLIHAGEVFTTLDTKHDGHVTREAVQATCQSDTRSSR
jgi:hypothetical protein